VYSMFSIEKSDYINWVIPLSMLVAVVIVLRHQIDSWYVRKSKPQMDSTLHAILKRKVFGYDEMFVGSHYNKTDHLAFNHDCDFIGQGLESIPDDLQHMVTAHAFFFGKETHRKWPSHYNRIVLYKHPFLSPRFDEDVHSVEHHHEDGVFIFSLEQGIPGIERPKHHYNIFLHGFADAFFTLYPVHHHYDEAAIFEKLEEAVGVTEDHLISVIGLDEINPLAVLAHYYVYRPEVISEAFPEFRDSVFANMNVPKVMT